jgi:hypothetical protein
VYTVHWGWIDGRPAIIGLDIRSFSDATRDRLPNGWPKNDRYAEVTQRVLRGISISAIREQVRDDLIKHGHAIGQIMASQPDGEIDAERIAQAYSEAAATLTKQGRPRKRAPSAGRDVLTRVAALYREAQSDLRESKTPARHVEQRLRAEGYPVSERGGRDQVRKWIQRAREQGLLPPAGQPPVTEPPRPTKKGAREK